MKWPWEKSNEPAPPPKVGGTRVPDQVLRIDFSKPHDFYCRFYGLGGGDGSERVFRSCTLLGFSTPVDEEGKQIASRSEWGGHDRWLVLRYPDGRLAYVPREGLLYIEETSPDGSSPGEQRQSIT